MLYYSTNPPAALIQKRKRRFINVFLKRFRARRWSQRSIACIYCIPSITFMSSNRAAWLPKGRLPNYAAIVRNFRNYGAIRKTQQP